MLVPGVLAFLALASGRALADRPRVSASAPAAAWWAALAVVGIASATLFPAAALAPRALETLRRDYGGRESPEVVAALERYQREAERRRAQGRPLAWPGELVPELATGRYAGYLLRFSSWEGGRWCLYADPIELGGRHYAIGSERTRVWRSRRPLGAY